ncbi:biotin/lipoate--protein ligase family protein [Benzoatithermus flavus]|uniref:Biotin/lipoate--protein ligase family protein n=1 Tax=Benzoatithermus flavus TaxID=3108223 RepID=A0ABU8XMU3_9PROT
MPLPVLPPAFQLVAVDRDVGAFERAARAAPRGVGDGTVYWTERTDRLEMAVVLEPEAPAAVTLQAVHVLMVATGDALGALVPPGKPIAFAWPSDILLDGALLGRVRVAMAATTDHRELPPWLVLGLAIGVGPLGDDPGRLAERTSLYEEGAVDVTVAQLVESVCRHFLLWTGRWLDEGLTPVQASWNARCFKLGETGEIALAGRKLAGKIRGIAADGAFLIGGERLRLDPFVERAP